MSNSRLINTRATIIARLMRTRNLEHKPVHIDALFIDLKEPRNRRRFIHDLSDSLTRGGYFYIAEPTPNHYQMMRLKK